MVSLMEHDFDSQACDCVPASEVSVRVSDSSALGVAVVTCCQSGSGPAPPPPHKTLSSRRTLHCRPQERVWCCDIRACLGGQQDSVSHVREAFDSVHTFAEAERDSWQKSTVRAQLRSCSHHERSCVSFTLPSHSTGGRASEAPTTNTWHTWVSQWRPLTPQAAPRTALTLPG